MFTKRNTFVAFAIVLCLLSGCTSHKDAGTELPATTESAAPEENVSTAVVAETPDVVSDVPATETQASTGTPIPTEKDTPHSPEKNEQNAAVNTQPTVSSGETNSTDSTESIFSGAEGLLDVEDGAGWG